ncbi:MAG TPA: glycosyltransferase family 2 protein [Casimicrobiaceae bacterium]|nr:glycosyltransferase family 2 protein [Casimicrobiaceae bacterium]
MNDATAVLARQVTQETAPSLRLSIVVPLYNERDNVGPLLQEVHAAMAASPWPWELILVDDGSADGTLELLEQERARRGDHVRVIAFRRNFGQTAAMQAGIEAARGDLVATLDGDLQNDPQDIIRLAQHLIGEDLDVVAGWRKQRQDTFLTRRLPSLLANRLIGRMTGVRLHDYGCTLKVFRAAVLKQVPLFGEMHRFIPAWLVTVIPVRRIGELVVNHRPRIAGKTKYGLWRTVHVLLDLLVVYFFLRYNARPGHFFGLLGLGIGGLGSAALAWLAVVKFVFGEPIGGRPLLLIGVVCVLAAIQLITTGVLAEILLRMGGSDGRRATYAVDPRFVDAPAGWQRPC